MKKITVFMLLLVIGVKGVAQKVDWVNAPMNPIAMMFNKEHFNLKGDVYAYGQNVFSKDGKLIYEYGISKGLHYLYKNGVLYADTDGKLYEFNSQGYLVKYSYASLGKQTQRYTYNAKGLLINLSNTKGYNVTYNYDEQGRLIKSNTGGVIKEFSYQKYDNQLLVTEKDLSKNPVLITKYNFKNGVEIGRNDNLFNLKYDKFGNKDGYESAIYYRDVENRNNEISVIYKKPSSASFDPLFNCQFYINGQKVDFLFRDVLVRKDIIIYNPFSEKYYIIENAIADEKSGQKQVFAKVLVNSPYTLRNRKGSSSTLGYKGAFLANTSNGMRDGALNVYSNPIYLVYDKTLNQTFYGDLDLANSSGYYPLQPISPQDNVVYLKTSDNQFVVVTEGKPNLKENPTHKLTSLKNGASVIKDEKGNPLYYLPGTATAKLNKLYPGKKYNPATDKLELASNTSTSPASSETNAGGIDKSPAVPTNATPTSSVKTNDAGSQSRLYNGKYTKETALIAINKYIDNLKKIGTHSFVGGTTKTYQIDGIWTQKITEQDKGTANIRYTIGDNGLTIELISAILEKNGKAIMLYPQSTNETIKKLYNNQVGMFVDGLFSYLGIEQNIASTTNQNTATKAIYYRPFTPVDISNKVLSPEVESFFKSYNNDPNKVAKYVTDIGTALKQKNYTGQAVYTKLTAILKEIYAIDRYAAFRIMMVVDKTAFDATLKLIPVEMRNYLREEAKFKIQQEKEMNATQP